MSAKQASRLLGILIAFNAALGYAQLNRSAVSVTGSDLNTCTTLTPCRSIAYALTQTNAGGAVIVLDSAGYGPFTASKTVSVEAAPGVYAGVTTGSGYGVTVSATASDTIVLRGLTLNGLGTADSGIAFVGPGARLYIENCLIQSFVFNGILAWHNIMVTDTTIRNCQFGILVDNAGGAVSATIDHVFVAGATGTGIFAVRNANVTVSNSLITLSSAGFGASQGGTLNVESCVSSNNYYGVLSESGSTVRVANTTATGNTTGWYVQGSIQSWGNNRTRGNGTDVSGMPVSIGLQ